MPLHPELDNWSEIFNLAAIDNDAARSQASAKASLKQVQAIANLSESVFSAQKHVSKRLEDLNQRLDTASVQSGKLARRTFWLTIALVVAAFAQVFTTWLSAKR